jgi:hypothetical protein
LAFWFWRRSLKFSSVFLLICYYLPLERGSPLYLNKLESFLPRMICAKAKWFWRRFLNATTPFLLFCDYLPFEEDLALYLNKLELPSSKDNLYQV